MTLRWILIHGLAWTSLFVTSKTGGVMGCHRSQSETGEGQTTATMAPPTALYNCTSELISKSDSNATIVEVGVYSRNYTSNGTREKVCTADLRGTDLLKRDSADSTIMCNHLGEEFCANCRMDPDHIEFLDRNITAICINEFTTNMAAELETTDTTGPTTRQREGDDDDDGDTSANASDNQKTKNMIIYATVGAVLLFLLIIAILVFARKRCQAKHGSNRGIDSKKNAGTGEDFNNLKDSKSEVDWARGINRNPVGGDLYTAVGPSTSKDRVQRNKMCDDPYTMAKELGSASNTTGKPKQDHKSDQSEKLTVDNVLYSSNIGGEGTASIIQDI